MSQLVKGTVWAKQRFELGSRPGKEKIADWIESGEVPGKLIAGEPYVDSMQFDTDMLNPQKLANDPEYNAFLT